MSSITFPLNFFNSPLILSGNTGSYTAPAGKQGVMMVNLLVSVITTNNTVLTTNRQVSSVHFATFSQGDSFTFAQSGEIQLTGPGGTFSSSFSKNGTLVALESITQPSSPAGARHFVSAKVSYSLIELPM